MARAIARLAAVVGALAVLASADQFRVYTNPNAYSDNVIPASVGVATLTATIDGAVDMSTAQCFAWYGYVTGSSSEWGTAVSMQQRRLLSDGGNRFTAQMPLVAGRTLQATAYCVAGGEFHWAPYGNIIFRLPPDQQHPAGAVYIIRGLSTQLGTYSVPSTDRFFSITVASQFQGPAVSPVAGSRCVARFGYPRSFGGPWPTVNETELSHTQTFTVPNVGLVDQWTGSVPLPGAGGLLEATARCTYNGIETWLGGNWLVQAN
eukprot:m51a1_g6455 hypothetical protein (262) ;mRNA; f:10024-10951